MTSLTCDAGPTLSLAYWAITCLKINIFDWTFFQVLEGRGIHVTTSLELDWSFFFFFFFFFSFFFFFFFNAASALRDSARAVANPIQPICYEILSLLIRLGKLAVF